MTVYDDIYLVGKIVEVNFLTSRVLLISDINSKVPITIQPLNIQGIMSGLGQASGQLQYISQDKSITKDNQKLIVVTSGVGGIFKSGIPIGEISSINTSADKKLIVKFYRNFSQLKYVKISSYIKENVSIDQFNKEKFQKGKDQISELNSQVEDIKLLTQQKVINNEIKIKLQSENIRLKQSLINTQDELRKSNEKIKEGVLKSVRLKFLELEKLYGKKCKKTMFRSQLFKLGSDEYKACILNKEPIKKN
jgi:rod shape-determining protein MreC